MGIPETVWTCSRCGTEIGRGPFKPHNANCPVCGTRFGNTIGGMRASSQERMDEMQRRNQQRMEEIQRRMQEDMSRNVPPAPNVPFVNTPTPVVSTPVGNPFTMPAAQPSRRTRTIIVTVVLSLMGIGLLSGAGFAIYYFTRKSAPVRARRAPREDRPRSRPTRPGTRARDLFRD